jgi:hypothetical protein
MTDSPFQLWMPLEPLAKSIAEGKGQSRPIQGYASTDDQDLQRDVMVQRGMDMKPFLEKGFIDWDHKGNLGPQYLIGEPESCELRPTEKGEGLFIKGHLYENHPTADAAWAMLERFESGASARQLGFSIDGHVIRRSGKYVQKAVIRHVALTHQPVNPFTFAQLAKSLADEEDLPPVGTCKECRLDALSHLIIHKGLSQDKAVQLILELTAKGLF